MSSLTVLVCICQAQALWVSFSLCIPAVIPNLALVSHMCIMVRLKCHCVITKLDNVIYYTEILVSIDVFEQFFFFLNPSFVCTSFPEILSHVYPCFIIDNF